MIAHPPAAAPGISYVYAIGSAGTPLEAAAPGLTGLEEGPLRTVSGDGLLALVSSVSHDAFSSEGMKAQMEDIERLETLARTHHSVVEAAYGSATVLPMRLATVYLDDARVRDMLRERRRDFGELLSWLEGHVELGVKVYADPREVTQPERQGTEAEATPVSPGRAYLRQRRTQRRSHQDAYRAAGAVAAQVPDRVAALARARVAHRPQQGELAASAGENIANEAYLVPAARVADFHAAVGALADDVPGVRIELTGPWAPYSFATPQAEPAEPGGEAR
ncbi:GvpL/GvpF family gas vesicle protein [Streptomyces sp. 150FB]|uniref:GvpL/GvpF family gas vesicle protein n=1 Tax=Streptomyces sp. 150FB TaxID=1576605 RepID=UPI00069816B7|nr:GvpL/GvpF family gas vesicle protein [Streptomyces sp. 150FB]